MPYHFKFEKDGYVTYEVDKKIPIGDIGTVDAKLTNKTEAQAKAQAAAAPKVSSNEKAVISFNSGVEALQAGDKPAAEAKFLEAVKTNPDLPAGWQALAQLAYEKKDWAKTIEYGQKATDLDPSLTGLYQMMADAARQMGDKAKAAEFSAAFADANPDSPEILYNKGVEAYNKGKMKDAEATLEKAVDAKPDFANAHYLLGMACFNQNKKGAGEGALREVPRARPQREGSLDGEGAAAAPEVVAPGSPQGRPLESRTGRRRRRERTAVSTYRDRDSSREITPWTQRSSASNTSPSGRAWLRERPKGYVSSIATALTWTVGRFSTNSRS